MLCTKHIIVFSLGNSFPIMLSGEDTIPHQLTLLENSSYKTNDRVTRTPLKIGGELRCSGRVSSSCSTSGTRRVNLVTNPVISREWGKDRDVFTTSGTYPWSFVIQIFHNGQPSHGGDRNIFELFSILLMDMST
jgi:hypothetical protein